MYQFSKTSLKALETCDLELQIVLKTAIQITSIDFGISEGHRSDEMQKLLFRMGKSTKDGVKEKSKHQNTPSKAVDIFAYVNGKANYEKENMAYLAGIIEAIAHGLKQIAVVKSGIRWGGNWDRDGEIITDQTFDDLCHFELMN